ncbi:MAG: response regulator transcription factor [Bacteroidetes bacterium]|nr:response regulator transcription factor [Bacteroidota bacterium]
MKILLIEDEVKTAQSLKNGLEENHFEVDLAYDGQTALQLALKNTYQVIISDIIIPHINGLEFCSKIREKGIQTPLLMLTALGTTEDKVTGFGSGADDYLVKPFAFEELMARVRALMKRSTGITNTGNSLRFADLELNLDTKTAFRSGKEIMLTAREFALMEYFMRNKGKVVSKTDIAEKVWDITFDTGTNVIEVYISYLRNKIDKNFPDKLIHTIHGLGYVLKEK